MELDNDDLPVGRVLTRREVLALFGATGAAFLAGCAPTPNTAQPTATATGVPTEAATSTATIAPTNTATTVPSSTVTLEPTSTATATLEPTATATATMEPTATAVPPTATAVPPTATAVPTEVAALSCVVRPELTEGPYFVDLMLNRSDIRSDPASGAVSAGTPLRLTFQVTQISANSCIPIQGALVDVWHCDALGVYSSINDPGFNTREQQFLRGYQLTDASGVATFTTIYPGWYQGRAVHIHFKIRSAAGANQSYEFTSQLFFDEALTDIVHAQEPYASKGYRTLLNSGDGIYRNGGDQLLLQPTPEGDGYAATFSLGLQI